MTPELQAKAQENGATFMVLARPFPSEIEGVAAFVMRDERGDIRIEAGWPATPGVVPQWSGDMPSPRPRSAPVHRDDGGAGAANPTMPMPGRYRPGGAAGGDLYHTSAAQKSCPAARYRHAREQVAALEARFARLEAAASG